MRVEKKLFPPFSRAYNNVASLTMDDVEYYEFFFHLIPRSLFSISHLPLWCVRRSKSNILFTPANFPHQGPCDSLKLICWAHWYWKLCSKLRTEWKEPFIPFTAPEFEITTTKKIHRGALNIFFYSFIPNIHHISTCLVNLKSVITQTSHHMRYANNANLHRLYVWIPIHSRLCVVSKIMKTISTFRFVIRSLIQTWMSKRDGSSQSCIKKHEKIKQIEWHDEL